MGNILSLVNTHKARTSSKLLLISATSRELLCDLLAKIQQSIWGRSVSTDAPFSWLAAPPLWEKHLSACKSSLWHVAHTEKGEILSLSFLLKWQHHMFTDQLPCGVCRGLAHPTQTASASAVAVSFWIVSIWPRAGLHENLTAGFLDCTFLQQLQDNNMWKQSRKCFLHSI